MEVPSVRGWPQAAVRSPAGGVAHVRRAPAQDSHLETKRREKCHAAPGAPREALMSKEPCRPESSDFSFAETGIHPSRLCTKKEMKCNRCASRVGQGGGRDAVSAVSTFTADGVLVPRGAPGAEEPVGYVLLQSHVGGLSERSPRLLHAAGPLQTETEEFP